MGFSFAVFHTFFGLPIGRLADSHSRRSLIAAGIATWSLFSAGCGLARNFAQMLFLRMGVGVGEAALSPSAYSLLTDYFPPRRRATAMSIYSIGFTLARAPRQYWVDLWSAGPKAELTGQFRCSVTSVPGKSCFSPWDCPACCSRCSCTRSRNRFAVAVVRRPGVFLSESYSLMSKTIERPTSVIISASRL